MKEQDFVTCMYQKMEYLDIKQTKQIKNTAPDNPCVF